MEVRSRNRSRPQLICGGSKEARYPANFVVLSSLFFAKERITDKFGVNMLEIQAVGGFEVLLPSEPVREPVDRLHCPRFKQSQRGECGAFTISMP